MPHCAPTWMPTWKCASLQLKISSLPKATSYAGGFFCTTFALFLNHITAAVAFFLQKTRTNNATETFFRGNWRLTSLMRLTLGGGMLYNLRYI